MKKFALILPLMLASVAGCETMAAAMKIMQPPAKTAPPRTMTCPAKVGSWIEKDNGDGTFTVTSDGLAEVSVYIDMLERAAGCEVE